VSDAYCTNEARVEFAHEVAELFPPGVIAIQVRGTVSPKYLLEEERECVARAADKRVQEFAAGRLCARSALSALGCPAAPLLPGPDRAPRWPNGTTGTISHTDQYCVAVVGRASRYLGVGVDAERIGQVQQSVWPFIFRPAEIALLETIVQ
jgi:4'-phosphopantetheinyl transferase EntD